MDFSFEILGICFIFVVVVKINGKFFFVVNVWNMKEVRWEVLDIVLRSLFG